MSGARAGGFPVLAAGLSRIHADIRDHTRGVGCVKNPSPTTPSVRATASSKGSKPKNVCRRYHHADKDHRVQGRCPARNAPPAQGYEAHESQVRACSPRAFRPQECGTATDVRKRPVVPSPHLVSTTLLPVFAMHAADVHCHGPMSDARDSPSLPRSSPFMRPQRAPSSPTPSLTTPTRRPQAAQEAQSVRQEQDPGRVRRAPAPAPRVQGRVVQVMCV
jgi:hypothetical protein